MSDLINKIDEYKEEHNVRSVINEQVNELVDDLKKDTSRDHPTQLSNSNIWWENVKEGDKDPTGRKIEEIISMAPSYILYFDNQNNIVCKIDTTEDIDQGLFIRYERLRQKINWTLDRKDQKLTLKALGRAFSHALDHSNSKKAYECFDDIREFVNTKSREKLHKYYIGSTFSFCLASIFIVTTLTAIGVNSDIWLIYLKGGCFGAVGALISVLQRFKKKRIQTYTSPSYIVFEGFSRIMLGAFFGIILMLAAKGGLFFTISNNSAEALALFAIISGLSERLVPEFIETIELKNRRTTDHTDHINTSIEKPI